MRQDVVKMYDTLPLNAFECTMVVNTVPIPIWAYRVLLIANRNTLHVSDHALKNFVM